MKRVTASFRDPSGYVFDNGNIIVRTINNAYRGQWESLISSGLMDSLLQKELVVPFREIPVPELDSSFDRLPRADSELLYRAWKCISPKRIPVISYPYEWTFSQLKDAALLTLEIQKESLAHGMTTKDASAYNVQFQGARPVFIDLLSFDNYREGDAWQGYRQFCMHFLAPLALYRHNLSLGSLSRLWIDGIPLATASKLLPWKSRFSLGLQMHIHAHARIEKKYSGGRAAKHEVSATTLSKSSLLAIVESLESTARSMALPKVTAEWGEYYSGTNYTSLEYQAEESIVDKLASRCAAKGKKDLAVNLGANVEKYSALLAKHYDYVVAADIDPLAVDSYYNHLKVSGAGNILPLVINLANPSPGLGWMCRERASFPERCKANFISALALVHRLRFTAGIPFALMAEAFAEYLLPGGYLLVEFVPREDSQVERLLAARDDIFADYRLDAFLAAFAEKFEQELTAPVAESARSLILLRRK